MVSQPSLQNQNVDISLVIISTVSKLTTTMRIFNCYAILILLSITSCLCFQDKMGVMGKIKAGFEIAGKFLGIDQTNTLAQMVSQTFREKASEKSSKGPTGDNSIFSGFLRLLGLDTKKLSAIAVNAIIFVAQLVSIVL